MIQVPPPQQPQPAPLPWGAGLNINFNDIIFEKEIAEGRYAKVYKANVHGTTVAVKVPKEDNSRIISLFKGEGLTLSRLQHENVCRWLGYSITYDQNGTETILLITEYLPGGKLSDAITLHRTKEVPLSLFARLRMARDIVRGMIFVHEQSLVHHDLKPENLMLDDFGRVKIVDFGFAEMKPKEPQTGVPKGSFLWMAPEVMNRQPYNHKSDVYSWAIILWQLITGAHEPYEGYTDKAPFIRDVGERGLRPPMPDTLHSIKQLLRDAWAQDPNARLTFLEINERLNAILIECAAQDEFARVFWRKFYPTQERVPWRDFVTTFYRFINMPLPEEGPSPHRGLTSDPLPDRPSAAQLQRVKVSVLQAFMKRSPEAASLALEEFRRRDAIEKLASLKTVLLEKDPYTGGETVHVERFGKITSLFGPISFNDPRHFLDKVRSVLKQKWFHGNLSREQACDALKGMGPGSFLVRLSTNPLHSAVISLNTGRNVNHIQIEFVPSRGFRLIGKQSFFVSLVALVEGYIMNGPLKDACPFASPFRHFQEGSDEPMEDIGYYYQLGEEFLLGEGTEAEVIRDEMKRSTPVGQTIERRQLGFADDMLSLRDFAEITTHLPNDEELAFEHRRRLRSRLELYGLRERSVNTDSGDCQFQAVSDQLYHNVDAAPFIRAQVVDWMRTNRAFVLTNSQNLRHFLHELSFEEYCGRMSQQGTWGDHVTLQVVSEIFKCNIWIVSSVDASRFILQLTPFFPTPTEQPRNIILSHHHIQRFGSLEAEPR